MSEKKAFVFDTNFIIQVKKLNDVVTNLQDLYSVYVAQISINERIAQQCRELKDLYDEAEKNTDRYKRFASIQFSRTFEETCKVYQEGIQDTYSAAFGNNIIPFSLDSETFSKVVDRANQKLPPFSSAKDASDKGFKDCILWFSLLTYFKDNGEEEVVFATDDTAFRNNADYLINEFQEITGKVICIKPNSFYNEILKGKEQEKPEDQTFNVQDLESIREQINETIESLRNVYYVNEYGDEYWYDTFTTTKLFDKDYMRVVFEDLSRVIREHIFEKTICATVVFGLDDRVSNGDTEIPIERLDNSLKLYQNIKKNYPDFIDQFLEATAKILNRNYRETSTSSEEDDLPF